MTVADDQVKQLQAELQRMLGRVGEFERRLDYWTKMHAEEPLKLVPGKFNPLLFFNPNVTDREGAGGAGGVGIYPLSVGWCEATAAWAVGDTWWSSVAANNEGDPAQPITVNIYHAVSVQPNVQDGDIVFYIKDALNSYICLSDVMDDMIGTVKFWRGLEEDIPRGWIRVADANDKFLVAAGVTIAVGDYDAGAHGAWDAGKRLRAHIKDHDAHSHTIAGIYHVLWADAGGTQDIYTAINQTTYQGVTSEHPAMPHVDEVVDEEKPDITPPYYALMLIERTL